MNAWQIIHKLMLGPVELLLDVIYAAALRNTGSPGWSVIVLSLAVSLLLLPLYKRADAIQKAERDRAIRMKPRIDQIRGAFTGNERFMILQTYYRQNHYKPYYALKSSVSLLLQIPFFMAAYGFLSGLQALQGVAFGPIRDLSAPDGLLQIGGMTVHLLPVLMTLVNILSGMLYSRDMPLKSKIQMYGLALVFLVLLYNSPSGLVLYWTMNNVFSLLKNAAGRMPAGVKDALSRGRSAVKKGLNRTVSAMKKVPGRILHGKTRKEAVPEQEPVNVSSVRKWIFWLSCVFLALLTGLLIPSEVIRSSPAEFVNIRNLRNPLQYLPGSALLAAGTFVLWCGVYYCMSGEKTRRIFTTVFAAAAAAAAINFMVFGSSYGDISSLMVYARPVSVTAGQVLLNVLAILAAAAAVRLLIRRIPGLLRVVYAACCIALAAVSVTNISAIQEEFRKSEAYAEEVRTQTLEHAPEIHLSRNGKNVMVIMLDRAVSGFIPYMLSEMPEKLARQFDGFVWYPNTLSFGFHTNVGSPPLYGGYEYTPDGMAERTEMTLPEKHNEALKVLPVLFLENGYDVTVMDPSLANYQWIPDLSIYRDYPEIHGYNAKGYFTDIEDAAEKYTDEIRNRNLFCYSLFRVSPTAIQPAIYHSGDYNETKAAAGIRAEQESLVGVNPDFLQNYGVMENLITMTEIQGGGENCFLMFATEETHDVIPLQEPEYVPRAVVDNSAYEEARGGKRTAADGSVLDLGPADGFLQSHYQCNIAAYMQLARWFEYLRQNGAWDNTRIIIVSDHAYDMEGAFGLDLTEKYPEIERLSKVNGEVWTATAAYEPVLMVKDFGAANGFSVSDAFMTNADTPALAITADPETGEAIVEKPENPITHNPISLELNRQIKQGELHLIETDWHFANNAGYDYLDKQVITFRGQDVTDLDCWIIEGY